MMSGRLVAATRKTPARPSAPSISVSSWFTTLRSACWVHQQAFSALLVMRLLLQHVVQLEQGPL
jgi:hypothetical protein